MIVIISVCVPTSHCHRSSVSSSLSVSLPSVISVVNVVALNGFAQVEPLSQPQNIVQTSWCSMQRPDQHKDVFRSIGYYITTFRGINRLLISCHSQPYSTAFRAGTSPESTVPQSDLVMCSTEILFKWNSHRRQTAKLWGCWRCSNRICQLLAWLLLTSTESTSCIERQAYQKYGLLLCGSF